MDSPLRMGMDYSEPKHFDPKEYLAMSCSPQEGSEDEKYFRNVHLKEVHKIFDSATTTYGKERILAKPRFVKQTQPIEDGPPNIKMEGNDRQQANKDNITRPTNLENTTSSANVVRTVEPQTRVVQPGSRLLDIGTGPTVYQLISASRFCTEIVCAEYAEANRAEVLKWIKGEPDAYDWNSSFQYVADLEGDSLAARPPWSPWYVYGAGSTVRPPTVHQRTNVFCSAARLLRFGLFHYVAIRGVRKFDVITSMKCLEVACPTRESYSAAVRSITRLLKPGGTLLMISVISESFHTIGGHKFFTLTVDESFIEEVLKAAGFNAIDIKTFPAPSLNQDSSIWDNNVSDFGGMAVVHARKL
ncbi:hypothetical protein Bbelb_282140 [Branchiostoma belcheri]|nr:hypothetical protein Bbelb_282140 [Branchiostoma belcheri]